MRGSGFHWDGARLDWLELMRFKRTFTYPVPKSREEAFGGWPTLFLDLEVGFGGNQKN
jgi:hypothetical protein